MTKFDAAWAAAEDARRADLAARGMYDPADEHSSCGVGLVVALDGKPSRDVVVNGIDALKAVWHRGAVDADGKTGDGAGIHVQIPPNFFYDQIRRTGHEPDPEALIAVGQVFLPRTDFNAQEACRTIVETEVLRMGHGIYGWRHVPVDTTVLGEKANATRPEIEQILIRNGKDHDEEGFERELYVIRRRIEKAAAAARLGRDMIKAVEPIDFQEFGMEAAWRIRVEGMPAFLVIDDKGNDFYRRLRKRGGVPVSATSKRS